MDGWVPDLSVEVCEHSQLWGMIHSAPFLLYKPFILYIFFRCIVVTQFQHLWGQFPFVNSCDPVRNSFVFSTLQLKSAKSGASTSFPQNVYSQLVSFFIPLHVYFTCFYYMTIYVWLYMYDYICMTIYDLYDMHLIAPHFQGSTGHTHSHQNPKKSHGPGTIDIGIRQFQRLCCHRRSWSILKILKDTA